MADRRLWAAKQDKPWTVNHMNQRVLRQHHRYLQQRLSPSQPLWLSVLTIHHASCRHKTLLRVSADKQTKACQLDNAFVNLQPTVGVKGAGTRWPMRLRCRHPQRLLWRSHDWYSMQYVMWGGIQSGLVGITVQDVVGTCRICAPLRDARMHVTAMHHPFSLM